MTDLDTGFTDLVTSDARGETTIDEQTLLRRPENLQRWHEELIVITQTIQDSHAIRKGRLEEALARADLGEITQEECARIRAETSGWRVRVRRFERSVDTRLKECKGLLKQQNATTNGNLAFHLATIARRTVDTWTPGADTPHDLAMEALSCALAAIPQRELREMADAS